MHGRRRVRTGSDVAGDGDTVELLQEVEVEPRPPELAIGDGAHAEPFDAANGVGDRRVFDLAQLGCGDLIIGALRPSLVHRVRTQQAADLVGAERRVHLGHDWTSTSPRVAH